MLGFCNVEMPLMIHSLQFFSHASCRVITSIFLYVLFLCTARLEWWIGINFFEVKAPLYIPLKPVFHELWKATLLRSHGS